MTVQHSAQTSGSIITLLSWATLHKQSSSQCHPLHLPCVPRVHASLPTLFSLTAAQWCPRSYPSPSRLCSAKWNPESSCGPLGACLLHFYLACSVPVTKPQQSLDKAAPTSTDVHWPFPLQASSVFLFLREAVLNWGLLSLDLKCPPNSHV